MLSGYLKHAIHCVLLVIVILVFEISSGGIKLEGHYSQVDPWEKYGVLFTAILYFLRCLVFLPLPQVLLNFVGLTFYNTFPDKVTLKQTPISAPFICVRVVTRGDYPDLVKQNVQRNLKKCLDVGLEHFIIQVVSDKPINLMNDRRVQELIVPLSYRTKSGAMFKSRALQYCLEAGVNNLSDHDWIVHLDEETLLTENSVKGIINFIMEGKYSFGQGLITYANEEVVNWITTLADSFRVADDMGKLRSQFKLFHKPVLSWKGSYVVTQVKAEIEVSYDNGPDGSIAEDCYFAMKAYEKGHSFNFIEGEMWEKSPFTLWDFMQQRKRWLQGILLVTHSKSISFKYKCFLCCSIYSWVTLPLSSANILLAIWCPIPCPQLMDFIGAFVAAVNIYMYIFGVLKSISLYRFGFLKFFLCIFGVIVTIPINVIIENIAVIWGLLGHKHNFYVVKKDVNRVLYV